MNKSDRFVFIINNSLEKYSEILSIDDNSLILWIGTLDQLGDILKTLDTDILRERILLILRREFINDQVLNSIISSFSIGVNFTLPYILYLTEENIEKKDEDIIDKGENFLYHLCSINPENKEIIRNNFRLYVKVIFQKLLTIERLNYYIVDSFQTIIDSALISKQKAEIENLNKEITEISKIDYLTNVLNRRAFFDALESERNRTVRDFQRLKDNHEGADLSRMKAEDFQKSLSEHYGRFSCILIDVDFFKKINDKYGHVIGDTVLKKMGEILKSKKIFRDQDIVARYGGEEFIIVLPETNSLNARIPAERLREYVKTIDFIDSEKKTFRITISIGISEFNINDSSNEDLIKRADEALYYAKERGRDQVVVFEDIF